MRIVTFCHRSTSSKPLCQWFLNLQEVPKPASFMQALIEPFLKIQKIFINKLNYVSVAHKIILFKETKPTKHELHAKTQLNNYLQINASYAVAFWKQF